MALGSAGGNAQPPIGLQDSFPFVPSTAPTCPNREHTTICRICPYMAFCEGTLTGAWLMGNLKQSIFWLPLTHMPRPSHMPQGSRPLRPCPGPPGPRKQPRAQKPSGAPGPVWKPTFPPLFGAYYCVYMYIFFIQMW